MGVRTGKPRGRPKGAKSKRTIEAAEKAKQVIAAVEAAVPGAFEGDGHALLIAVYKDPRHPIELRVDCAKAAMTREKPALAAIDVTSQNEHVVHTISDKPVDRTGEDWLEAHSAH